MGSPQARVTTSCRRCSRQRSALGTTILSSATAHPEQVEAPESNEDQGARAHAQQQYDCFQHGRNHSAGVAKACAPVAILSSFSWRRRPDETIFRGDENILKQRAAYLVGSKTGTADMQFIFDLIWNQSRSRFLATIGEQETEQ